MPRSSNGRAVLLQGTDGGSIPSRGTKLQRNICLKYIILIPEAKLVV